MNKTVSINLGGLFFHIDENAYQKLNHYFDAIRRSLSPDGKDEIMNDIEGRIAELLSEKIKIEKQVVGMKEVEEVIAIMGQPEDYRIEDDENTPPKSTYTTFEYAAPPKSRKFYRDGDKAIIAGVCAGIAHYFRIDPLWIRILFIVSPFVSFGTSLIVYVLLWILIPKAITTTEKLEMTGEPINISNIERKVKEEFESISSRLSNVDYDKIGANANKVGNSVSNVFMVIFKGIAKVIGAIITILTGIALGGVLIAFFTMLFSSTMPNHIWFPYADGINYTETPIWVMAILGLLAVAIPLFAIFLLGLKILVENSKSIGPLAKYTLLVLWLASLGGLTYIGIHEASEVSSEGKTFQKQEIYIGQNDTLNIKFRYNSYYSKSFQDNTHYLITQDSSGNNVIYSNNISLYVLKTDEPTPYLQVEKIALGNSLSDARNRAKKIDYNFKIERNNLILDNYLLSDTEHKYRDQKVELYLYIPKGTYIHPDSSVREYDNSDNSFFDLWFDSDAHIYRMEAENVKCLDCDFPEDIDNNVLEENEGWNEDHIHENQDKHDNIDVNVNLTNDKIRIKAVNKKH